MCGAASGLDVNEEALLAELVRAAIVPVQAGQSPWLGPRSTKSFNEGAFIKA